MIGKPQPKLNSLTGELEKVDATNELDISYN